ncbi:helix-turn-helix transcriptional regulator [bacterium]|nr:helix-turn-helix transcriptional regulator [bacterium]
MLNKICQYPSIIGEMTRVSENINEKIGTKIRLERVKRKWSQEKLAELADINKNSVSSIERAEWSASIETIAKIAEAFGMELPDLVNVSKVEI